MPNSSTIDTIFRDCLFRDDEIKDGKPIMEPLVVEGIVRKYGFHPERIKNYQDKIIQELQDLPDTFYEGKGGGWSFLNLCNDKNGHQWTSFHLVMEQLVCLGIAIGMVEYVLPREMWSSLPGGVPYIVIKPITSNEKSTTQNKEI